jgi:hypothetical protein
MTVVPSGAEGIRTPDLRRARAKKCILARAGVSGYSAVLQVIYWHGYEESSAACRPVLARLQYVRGSVNSCACVSFASGLPKVQDARAGARVLCAEPGQGSDLLALGL